MGALFGAKPTIDITIDDIPDRKKYVNKKKGGETLKFPCFRDKETVSGKVVINLNKANSLEHLGVKVELIGEILISGDKKSTSRFTALSRDLEPPGELTNEINTYTFSFANVEKQFETYRGKSIEVHYLIRCTLSTKLKTFTSEEEFGVLNPEEPSADTLNEKIKLDVKV